MKPGKSIRICSLMLLSALLTAGSSLADSGDKNPFDGVWRNDKISNGNIVISSYFVFDQDGQKLKGHVLMNFAMKEKLNDIKLKKNRATFSISWGVKYEATVNDGVLTLLTTWPGGSPSESKYVQVSPDEIIPPQAEPLPELEKVKANGLALTPPMGWNSWNHFSSDIDDKTVREIADAMVSSGMAKAGYEFIVIDDGWQGGRDADGNIFPNEKFPDMKALADYVHGKGLKLGIYSSPGHTSCGGYVGSYRHELQDAKTFAEWGIDYLKYDWCGAQLIYGFDRKKMQASYQIMGNALLECGRPIVYSICQYGRENVWEWAADAGGNLWRTTGDINDSWGSITGIAFSQHKLYPYAKPGHWNDPDMLEVGNGGLSIDQNKTHFTMWCMLAAPLLAGNDLRHMSDDTIKILTNPDLIAINQDTLGKQARRLSAKDDLEIYVKPLSNGELASAVVNRTDKEKKALLNWKDLGWHHEPEAVVDVWAQETISSEKPEVMVTIPANGVVLMRGK